MDLKSLQQNQPHSSSRLLDFKSARVGYGFNPDIPLLFVSGEAPCSNMHVDLLPLIYVDCPEYWGVELIGHLPGDVCLDAIREFDLVMELTSFIGSKGIELIGSNKPKRFDVEGGCTRLNP